MPKYRKVISRGIFWHAFEYGNAGGKGLQRLHSTKYFISKLHKLLKCVHGSCVTYYVAVNNTINTSIQVIRVPDIQIHSFSAGDVCIYLYFTFTSSTPLTTDWNVFLTLTATNLTLSNKCHTLTQITQLMRITQRVCTAHYKISCTSL